MTLSDLLSDFPAPSRLPHVRGEIRERLRGSGSRIIVLDDDPTGTQTVHDVPVYTRWTTDVLEQALTAGDRVFFLSTNSRALSPDKANELAFNIGRDLVAAAREIGFDPRNLIVASRSDSTLRGHYPGEVDALLRGLNRQPDGVVIAPFFPEGGRYTVDDVHYVDQSGDLVEAHRTEFARDPDFGYRHSDLKEWIEEKTEGRIPSTSVLSVDLKTIRESGATGVAAILRFAEDAIPVVINAACYEDLEVAVAGLIEAEAAGKSFAYRCAASFIKVRAGIEDRALVSGDELGARTGPGLVVVGSYVEKSTRQLERLLDETDVVGVELRITRLLDDKTRRSEIAQAANAVDILFDRGISAALYTTREPFGSVDPAFLQTGSRIMNGLCETVRAINAHPAWFIAKGGITSIDIARTALSIDKARVIGQILPGVPVWKAGNDSDLPSVPYVVFPGNVGDSDALVRVYERLTIS